MKQKQIADKLTQSFSLDHLEVIDESEQHSVPPGSESHFKVIIVATEFERLGLVKRHQAVYAALSELISGGIHALALHTLSPKEWQSQESRVPESPPCLGGSANKSE